MIGAIIGDIVGSRFEFDNHRSKKFDLFTFYNFFTDDSVMTIAIGKALLDVGKDYSNLSKRAVYNMQKIGRRYPDCGYGSNFYHWVFSDNPKPYNSYGNGSAMRISAVGHVANSIEEAIELSKVTVTHNAKRSRSNAVLLSCRVRYFRNWKLYQ